MDRADDLVTLATASNQIEAELWQAVLADHGIQAMLKAGDVQSYLGVAPIPVRLLVRPQQRAAAEQVLAALSETPEGEMGQW